MHFWTADVPLEAAVRRSGIGDKSSAFFLGSQSYRRRTLVNDLLIFPIGFRDLSQRCLRSTEQIDNEVSFYRGHSP